MGGPSHPRQGAAVIDPHPRLQRIETLVEDLTHRLHQALATPDKTAEDFHDAIEALAIVAAAIVVGSRSEEALDFFGRRLLAHVEAISNAFPPQRNRLH